MRLHSSEFKEQIKEMGRQIDSRITYNSTSIPTENLYSIKPILNTDILKSVMKGLKFEAKENLEENQIIKYEFGLLVNDNYEWLDYGNYIIYKKEYNEDTKIYSYTAYDKMLNSMKTYTQLSNQEFPMTLKSFLTQLLDDIGIELEEDIHFINEDKIIENDIYKNIDYTYRDILDNISQAVAGNIIINNEDKATIKYVNDTQDVIDGSYIKNTNVKFGKKYGPINSLILSRSAESDRIYRKDEDSIAEFGLTELIIKDNVILNENNRGDYIDAIFNQLNGLEYCINDYSSTGVLYYEALDLYYVLIDEENGEEKLYTCLMLNDEPKITQGLVEDIFTEQPAITKSDYITASKDDRNLAKATIIADKANATINAVTSKISDLDDKTGSLETRVETIQTDTYTKTQIQEIISSDGYDDDGNIINVKAVVTTEAKFDKDGMRYSKSNAPTSTLINYAGLKVDDAIGNKLLFAGVDNNEESVTYGNNIIETSEIKSNTFFQIEEKGRLAPYKNGVGLFLL